MLQYYQPINTIVTLANATITALNFCYEKTLVMSRLLVNLYWSFVIKQKLINCQLIAGVLFSLFFSHIHVKLFYWTFEFDSTVPMIHHAFNLNVLKFLLFLISFNLNECLLIVNSTKLCWIHILTKFWFCHVKKEK